MSDSMEHVKDSAALPRLGSAIPCLGRLVLATLGTVTALLALLRLVKRYVPIPAPAFVGGALDSRFRRAFQPPAAVLAPLGIAPGMTVLEVGPGPGTYTTEAACRSLPGGRVIAVDLQEGMLRQLRRKAQRLGLANIETHRSDAYHLPLPDASVDVAFMVTVLAEIPDRRRALAEIRRVLRPGGVFAVSEFLPDPDYPRRTTVRRWLAAASFVPDAESGGLLWYVLTFRKPTEAVGQ